MFEIVSVNCFMQKVELYKFQIQVVTARIDPLKILCCKIKRWSGIYVAHSSESQNGTIKSEQNERFERNLPQRTQLIQAPQLLICSELTITLE